jgi:cytochrome c-type biogenesis protein CcmH
MTLWLVLLLMTAVALVALGLPFVFGGQNAPSGHEVAVYKDQLVEIDRDLETGLIGPADAGAARVEVSRRLLSASSAPDLLQQTQFVRTRAKAHRLSALVISAALLPIFAGGMYLRLGSPGAASAEKIVDQPTTSPDDAKINAMLAEVESHLKDNPSDGQGWETLAPIYMHMGRYDEAARAWRNAIANLGDSVAREESLGEALFAAADGVVTDEARRAFNQALSIDHDSVDARFYIGLAAKQGGRPDEAAKIWRELIATAPPDADWVDTIRDALAQLEQPSIATTDRVASSETQQAAMIKSMVEGLSERLKADGGDPDGWLRLVRSYNVLGERDKAQTALADARRALASDPGKLARFEQGLNSGDSPVESAPPRVARQPASPDTAPPEHDNATMQAMVDKLAERLKAQGGDVDSWLMLVRSYEMLGEHDRALAAAAEARQAFASDPEKLFNFDQLLHAANSSAASTSTPNPPSKPQSSTPTTANAAPAEQQTAMIRGMVNRLAERLARDGHDVDGWIRLMRSYVVLGQPDQATAAGLKARIALENDTDGLRRLNGAAKELGLELP